MAADLGQVIRRQRQAVTMTQDELANQIGTTRQWINRLENGDERMALSRVLRVLSVLKLEMVALYVPPPQT